MENIWSETTTDVTGASPDMMYSEATAVAFATFTGGGQSFSLTIRGFHEPGMVGDARFVQRFLALCEHMKALGYRATVR